MNKDIQLIGLGNGIIDVLVEVPDSFLKENSLEKASMELVDLETQEKLIKKLSDLSFQFACGGSVCNSIATHASLGGQAAMITSLGSKHYSKRYRDELDSLNILYSQDACNPNHQTGSCLVMITPDGERTMRTSLGASALLSEKHINKELIQRSEILFIEGYLIANPNAKEAVKKAAEFAKSVDTKVALTLSADSIVTAFKADFEALLNNVDILFANELEATALTSESSPEKNALILSKLISDVIVTASEKGAYISSDDTKFHVPAIACDPLDLTGAGDTFAAGYLYGKLNGYSAQQSAELATYLANRVITQIGPRIQDLDANMLRENSLLH